jgi:hypothetical protein
MKSKYDDAPLLDAISPEDFEDQEGIRIGDLKAKNLPE